MSPRVRSRVSGSSVGKPWTVRRRSILQILAVTVIIVGALAGLTRGRTGDSVDATPQPRRSFVTSVITPVGHDRFSIVPIARADATMTSPMTNVDSNLREVFWDSTAADIVDGGACATWQSASTADLQ